MVTFCERVGWLGDKLDLVWTSLVCIDDSAWFLKALLCCSRLFLVVIFGALFWWFFWCLSGPCFWRFDGGNSCEPFVVLLPLIPLPNPWVKVSILWFSVFRVRWVLGGISSIPLDLASFDGQNRGYGLLMKCSYYPQSLVEVCGAIREIEVWIWRSWPAGAVHPELPGYTGLTGAPSVQVVFWGVFVPGYRKVTKALWNACCADAVATCLTDSVNRSDRRRPSVWPVQHKQQAVRVSTVCVGVFWLGRLFVGSYVQ
jgi:hypothetical protein